ncbi:hypothetical protein [Archangium lipolyticum]|uniref:hypothetical protein n=1 Tax=Archangium lipolyticum TaxID=2970465 RepID=UPI00214A184C|nr:hypothetical protein [Archangium lipolyticum]
MTLLAENGFARCEKLTAHPEFERWKDMMSPGEFWSTVGESWLEKVGEPASHEAQERGGGGPARSRETAALFSSCSRGTPTDRA